MGMGKERKMKKLIAWVKNLFVKPKTECYGQLDSVFENLESEYFMNDVKKNIPDSIFIKLDTRKSVRTIKIPMTTELKGKPNYGNPLVDIIKGKSWHV